ncbi:efflux RND transporter permease subunit [Tundrisphaera lichenicola]|uniref:efflux RND transporter permease subunit n=1 Tax=Tundrisphaera lichenicola TaxID=2029860 RepID=UPI003EBED44E
MNGLIRASLGNPYAVTVFCLTILLIGTLCLFMIPVDILPVFKSPAVQVLTFYGGMPAEGMEKDITSRMERWVGQANGLARQESRSIVGASIVRDYFQGDVDPNGALTQVNSLALASVPNLPPGTLPPVVLPFDPTSSTPIGLVALNSETEGESTLYDVGRYEVRNMIMALPGAVAPVVYGGKVRAVMLYLDRNKMQARGLSPLDVMKAMDNYNVFLPAGDAKFGGTDYAIDSNSMYDFVEKMGEIPLRTVHGNAAFMRDVATPKDDSFIQTNIVRVNGRKQVYIPVFRQLGSSTLKVVDNIKSSLAGMKAKLSKPGIDLKLVMDQSVYVRQSISSLVQEGILGAILCSLVILLFLGQIKMTAIAIMTLPLAVMSAVVCLLATGNTINVMTLSGLSLAIGPMVDSAIICLENTHRHLGLGASPEEAAYKGASEVALPELVATLCTFLVLAPLALMPGLGAFLFRPMALAVAFAMISAYVLSRTFVPSRSAMWLSAHEHGDDHGKGFIGKAFARWEAVIDRAIALYVKGLDGVMKRPRTTIALAFGLLGLTLFVMSPIIRREFFPEADAGAFEMAVRAPSGTRIEVTNQRVDEVEKFLRAQIPEHDLELIVSEIGVTADWSAAYTQNAGPMDAMIKVQLAEHRSHSAQEYASKVRTAVAKEPRFSNLEFAFDTGGLIRGALNEGKSTPINIRITGKNLAKPAQIAALIQSKVKKIDGVVDSRILQRQNYPEFIVNVDRTKAADLGMTQEEVMRNVVAALNSSITFNKKNFWIDPKSHNQYFVGVAYPEKEITSIDTMLDIPITGALKGEPVPLRTLANVTRTTVPTEITHNNIQPSIDLTMGVEGRDLGHVADDIAKLLEEFGKKQPDGSWAPYEPSSLESGTRELMTGSKILLSGEYSRMQQTFRDLGIGLILAVILIYFLMVALVRSYVVPLCVILVVPLVLIGVLPMLYLTGTAMNVQSLLGVIFIVGISVSNTVLLTDYAQELRKHEQLSVFEAIRKAASIRVRPVTMTALAAFFAMIPAAMAIERGSEANAPLARAILGGLMAGGPGTLFVLPCLYMLMVKDKPENIDFVPSERDSNGHGHESQSAHSDHG